MKALSEMLHKNLLVSIIHRAFKEFWGSSRFQPGNRGQEAEIYRAMSVPLKGGITELPLPSLSSTSTKYPLTEDSFSLQEKGLRATTAFLISASSHKHF